MQLNDIQDDLIQKIATLMAEQSAAYTSLESLMTQLITALTRCDSTMIESISRAGETELFRMRSRLLSITSSLTRFAELRSSQTESTTLDPNAREQFEMSANKLLEIARRFEKIAGRATCLALGGLSFSAAGIEMCGVPQSTYRAPLLKYCKGAGR